MQQSIGKPGARALSVNAALVALSLASGCVMLSGCVVQAPPRVVYVASPPPVAYVPPPPAPVVSIYEEPLLVQPPPLVIGWAPPPMLVDVPPPLPFDGAIWIGGYWAWRGNWVWATGRWAPPPQPGYGWVNPYYENRSGVVVFIGGHWAGPGVVFVPPPPSLNLTVSVALAGVIPGPRPIGPPGIFVPPPPGSRLGLIVPAPLGTPPAVVIGAPPVTNVGMRIQSRTDNINNNTVVNNTRITNVTNVTIVAPAGATASGRAYEGQAPMQAHLAAAQTPVVRAAAPRPAGPPPPVAAPMSQAQSVAPPAARAPTQSPTAATPPARGPAQAQAQAPGAAAPQTPQARADDKAARQAAKQQADARHADAAKAKADRTKDRPHKGEDRERRQE